MAWEGLSVGDILEATKGSLVKGNYNDCFSGVSIDSRTLKEGEVFIAIQGNNFDGHNFIPDAVSKGARCVIVREDKAVMFNRMLAANIICVRNTLDGLISLAYYHRKRFDIPVVCITGSNGKTTTKEMLSCLLSASYNVLKNEGTQNNIIGLSLALLKLKPEHDIAVLELGTNHHQEISALTRLACPSVGIITNIGFAHLEYLFDTKGVFKEKWNLIEELNSPRIAVLNADDPLLNAKISGQTLLNEWDITPFTFGINNKSDFMARRIRVWNNKLSFLIKNKPIEINTASYVNVYNALAAYTAARIFSIDAYDIINQFKKITFPKSRFQLKRVNGINIIDDAYNANPDSFRCALESFKKINSGGRKIAVIADMLELGSNEGLLHHRLGEELLKAKVDFIVAVGRLSHVACDAALLSGFAHSAVHKCATNEEAKNILRGIARKNDTILLKGSRAMKLEEVVGF